SDASLVAVSSSGLVTGRALGTAVISATLDSKTASTSVTVSPTPVTSVTVSLSAASIATGQTTQAVATARDASGNVLTGRAVAWSTSTPSIATVSATGVVTGVAAGTATIIATVEGKTGVATETVTQVPVASVTVSLQSSAL